MDGAVKRKRRKAKHVSQPEDIIRVEIEIVREIEREEANVALKAAPNPFLCTLYLNKICLNQREEKGDQVN